MASKINWIRAMAEVARDIGDDRGPSFALAATATASGTAAKVPLLEVAGMTVSFPSTNGALIAVDGISFSVDRGETVAIVGESGSGKSMTALATMRLTPPGSRSTAERILLDGTDMSRLSERAMRDIRGRRVAMIFQNPMSSLNPVLTVGRQITESLERHLRMGAKPAKARAIELLALVEVASPARVIGVHPHQLSGGMRQRVMIAMALAGNPDLLIADEPTTALDVTVQAQILELLARLQAATGMAILLITHDLGIVAGVANRVYVMYGGRVMEHGRVADVLHDPVQPYTMGLLSTVRQLGDDRAQRLAPIPGQPPSIGPLLVGCPFASRCSYVIDRCTEETPALRPMGPDRAAACHLAPVKAATS